MQENTITLAVDETNTGSTTDITYRRYEEGQNKAVYVSPDNTLLNRDQLAFFRSLPKVNGNFRGMAKSSAKFTQDLEVPGVDSSTDLTVPMIVEVSMSLPVGATAAEALLGRQRAIALLDDDAVMIKLEEGLEV